MTGMPNKERSKSGSITMLILENEHLEADLEPRSPTIYSHLLPTAVFTIHLIFTSDSSHLTD